ncbi:SpaA isopeptide-forming pilin-related protein [Streptomyces sp. NPDC055078]
MRTPATRRPLVAAAVLTGALGTLAWTPSAVAAIPSPSPAPSSETAPRDTPEPDPGTGGIRILKKDPGGALLRGAAFTLLDRDGKGAGSRTTDAGGQIVFEGLTPGVYRLKETSSGSPLHGTVADQDVIVPPGGTVPLAIVDPFKPADLTVTKTDRSTGKSLPGAVINITPQGGGRTVTLTTGKDGTAKTTLPVAARTGTPYTATESKAPAGYRLNAQPVKITARPGAPVALAHTGVKTANPTKPPAKPPATAPPVIKPSAPTLPTAGVTTAPTPSDETRPASRSGPATRAPEPTATTPDTAEPAVKGSLADTGADAAPWLIGGAAALLTAGGGALWAVRHRAAQDTTNGKGNQSTG